MVRINYVRQVRRRFRETDQCSTIGAVTFPNSLYRTPVRRRRRRRVASCVRRSTECIWCESPQSQSASDASRPDPCLQQFLNSKLSPHNYSVLITALAQLHFTLTSAGIQPIIFMGSLLGSWRHHDIIPVHSR